MIKELDIVSLTTDVPSAELEAGEEGTIVHVYPSNTDFEVEFPAKKGRSGVVASLPSTSIRPLSPVDSELRN